MLIKYSAKIYVIITHTLLYKTLVSLSLKIFVCKLPIKEV